MPETFRFAPPYELPQWPFRPSPAQAGERYPVVIVGGGLAGLTLACDLAQRGVRSVLLDEDDTVGVRGASSRGICYGRKSLEIFERLGLYERVRAKGVTWSVGRTFSAFGGASRELYAFNLANDNPSRQPPFINLQQFYVEWFLVDRIAELGLCDLRWKHRVTRVEEGPGHVRVEVETPAGAYALQAAWLIDGTGANSPIREQLGLRTNPSHSTDRWCISDVKFAKPLPVERWTWIAAPFNEGRGVWQHLMADQVWRMDYQMDEHADPQDVSRPEVAGARLRAQLGPGVDFEFVWIGPYQYRDHLLEHYRHGRIFFIGDAAHVVCPFGARGGNNGIQDAANLGWKLALVLQGAAGEGLLDSYHAERHAAAAENLAVTQRSARFISPRSAAEHELRSAVLGLAGRHAFARPLVNSGRMTVANAYPASPWLPSGACSLPNLALGDGSVMGSLREGTTFLGLCFGIGRERLARLRALEADWPLRLVAVEADAATLAAELQAKAGEVVLLRPDAYIAARFADDARPREIEAALAAALAGG